jgi:hypothetical protein
VIAVAHNHEEPRDHRALLFIVAAAWGRHAGFDASILKF